MKIFYSFFVLLFVSGCGNFEFVYAPQNDNSKLKKDIHLSVVGDDSSEVFDALNSYLGNKPKEVADYELYANSIRTDTAQVIEKDATASKFKIDYKIEYNLYSLQKNCSVYKKTLYTENSYESKSEGYSFGTDFSKKETAKLTINESVRSFVSSLAAISELSDCND
tara:strand:- start:320 stop:817 length:498 start_codon:yes stop_codon:yes gene_type:complete